MYVRETTRRIVCAHTAHVRVYSGEWHIELGDTCLPMCTQVSTYLLAHPSIYTDVPTSVYVCAYVHPCIRTYTYKETERTREGKSEKREAAEDERERERKSERESRVE